MLFSEWNWDDAKRVWQEEAREDGFEEGIEKGIEKGKEESLLQVAKNARSRGMPIEVIQDLTGLDIKTIDMLR
jgi:predicted transposase/invertase (TIGR01784 family)